MNHSVNKSVLNICCATIVICLLLGDVPGAAMQKATPLGPQKWGLIIAVDDTLTPGPSNAEVGHRIADLLKSRYGYDAEKLLEMYNQDAIYEKIVGALYHCDQYMKSDDSFFAYIAMPVKPGRREITLVTMDRQQMGISYTQIEKMLASLPTRTTLLVLDGCIKTYTQSAFTAQQMTRQYDPRLPFQVLSICAGEQRADKLGDYLCRILEGHSGDFSGRISVRELVSSLRAAFPPLVESLYLASEYQESDFVFTPQIMGIDPDLVRRINEAQSSAPMRSKAIEELIFSFNRMPIEKQAACRVHVGEILLPIAANADLDPLLRSQAIMALGQLKNEENIAAIIAILSTSTSKPIKEACIQALAEMPTSQAQKAIRQTLLDVDPSMRISATRTLIRLNDTASLPDILNLLQHDRDIGVRLTALALFPFDQLDKRKSSVIIPELLQDANSQIRNEVVNVFGRHRVENAIDLLTRQFAIEKDAGIRQNIAFKLGQLFDEAHRAMVEEILLKAFDKDAADQVKAAAAISLGIIKATRAEDKLIKGLEKRNPEIKRSAAEALGNLRSRKAVDKLVKLLDDEVWEVRRAAVVALGESGDDRAIAPLRSSMNDANMYVRTAAEAALTRIQADPGRAALLEALNAPAAKTRMEAIRVLGASKDPQVVPHLLVKLADDDYGVRKSALAALLLFKDEQSFNTISANLDNDNFLMRQGVVTILGEFASPASVELLIYHFSDNNSAVRREIGQALGNFDDDRVLGPLVDHLSDLEPSVADAAALSLIRHGFRLEKLGRQERLTALAEEIQMGLKRKVLTNKDWATWFKLFFIKNSSPTVTMTLHPGNLARAKGVSKEGAHVFANNELVKFILENASDLEYYVTFVDLESDGTISILTRPDRLENLQPHATLETIAVVTAPDDRTDSFDVIKAFVSQEPLYFPGPTSRMDFSSLLPRLQTAVTAEIHMKVARLGE